MKRKKDNNLICVSIADTPHYFTSATKAGNFIGLAGCSVTWAITHNNILKTEDNREIKISVVDGSDIAYKYINND